MCSGKCDGNMQTVCWHEANRSYMSHQRGNYYFHLEGIKYISVIFLGMSETQKAKKRSRGKREKLLSICSQMQMAEQTF